MLFKQIVCIDETGLTPEGYRERQQFSSNKVINYSDYPASNDKIIGQRLSVACRLL